MQLLAVQKIGMIIAEINWLSEPIITPKLTWLYAQPNVAMSCIHANASKIASNATKNTVANDDVQIHKHVRVIRQL
jgi:hypothetical protein